MNFFEINKIFYNYEIAEDWKDEKHFHILHINVLKFRRRFRENFIFDFLTKFNKEKKIKKFYFDRHNWSLMYKRNLKKKFWRKLKQRKLKIKIIKLLKKNKNLFKSRGNEDIKNFKIRNKIKFYFSKFFFRLKKNFIKIKPNYDLISNHIYWCFNFKILMYKKINGLYNGCYINTWSYNKAIEKFISNKILTYIYLLKFYFYYYKYFVLKIGLINIKKSLYPIRILKKKNKRVMFYL
jgi:hypothetical protein